MSGRRDFIKRALGISALFLAEPIAHPVEKLLGKTENRTIHAGDKIFGTVTANGKPIPGVAVSDGATVTVTAADGSYSLAPAPNARFIYISNPAGYATATNEYGIARFYRTIPGREEPEENENDGENGNNPDDGTNPNNGNKKTGEAKLFDTPVDFELKPSGDDTVHSFFFLADPQMLDQEDVGRFRDETLPDIMMMAEDRKNLFCITAGDIVFSKPELFEEYQKVLKRTKLPFYQVVGNHDTDHAAQTNENSVKSYERYFGPDYYSFNKGKIHYVVLNDVFWFGDYMGYLEQKQLDWLKADLALVEKGSTVVVFAHIPPYNTDHIRHNKPEPDKILVVTNRDALYELLKPFKTYFITGHMHESEYIEDNGFEIHVVGAVCGAWWTENICWDGTPNGYGMYEVNGSELKWKYKSTGRPHTYQLALYKKGSIKNRPDEVVANVWGWDKYGKVNWYEDGEAKGEMTRITGKDPQAVNLFEGKNKPEKHPWVEPVVTNHLFVAKPSAEAKMVVVEFVNRFGDRFVQRLRME